MSWESELFEFRTYSYHSHAGDLSPTACRIRDPERVREISIAMGGSRVDLTAEDGACTPGSSIELDLEFRPSGEVDQATPWLQLICERTRYEQATPIEPNGAPAILTTAPIDIDSVRGDVLARVLYVSTADPGLVVGESEPVVVRVDPPPDAFGGGLRTKWSATFFESKQIPAALSYLYLPTDDEPTLYLNNGIPNFQQIIESKGERTIVARLRQFLLDTIEVETWFALGRHCAGRVYRLEDDDRVELRESEPDAWCLSVLRAIASKSRRPDYSPEEIAWQLLDPSQHDETRSALQSNVGAGGLGKRIENIAVEAGALLGPAGDAS